MKTWGTILFVKPQAKQSTRFAGHAYTEPAKRRYSAQLRGMLLSRDLPEPFRGPVAVSLRFVFPCKRNPGWHSAKPDIDNCAKPVLDAMRGVLFADDCAVVKLHAEKVSWRGEGCIVVRVSEAGRPPKPDADFDFEKNC